jgi:hypothetical protein
VSYADTQSFAKRLLTDKGQAVTLTPPVSGTYSTTTRTNSGSAGTPVSTVGLVLPLSRGLKHMAGTDIKADDQQLLLPGDIAFRRSIRPRPSAALPTPSSKSLRSIPAERRCSMTA